MLYSIGHSNIMMDKFITILKSHSIAILYDTRGIPYSKYATQFNITNLEQNLAQNNISYIHSKCLNGIDTSKNNYPTDIMEKELNKIIISSNNNNVVIMGANSNYKDCHREKLCNWIIKNNPITIHHIQLDVTLVNHILSPTQINLF